jgi:hypothetical protein
MSDLQTETRDEIAALRAELELLNSHRFVRIHNNMWRLILFQFVRGLALGLGTVVGASILVSLIAYLLAQIDFLPIIGDWATAIAEQMQPPTE